MHAPRAGGGLRATSQFAVDVRFANAICAYAMYLWKMIWPARLAPLYPHPGDSLAAWKVLVAGLVLVAITAVAFRERRYLVVGCLWFLGTLVPVIGLVQVSDAAMADRYAYIPLIGVFVMIAFGMAGCTERISPAWVAGPAVLSLVVLAFATHRQIAYWQSNVDLWSHTMAVTKNNFIAEDNLGGALILEGKEEEAHPHFEAAATINPKDPMSRSNLGIYDQTHNRMPEAVVEYEAAIGLTPDPRLPAQTYANLGAAQHVLGKDEEARTSFDRSLRLNATLSGCWLRRGLLACRH
jgi:protein O-mannosyl-transferase